MTAITATVPPINSMETAGLGLMVPTNTDVMAPMTNCTRPMRPRAVPEFFLTCVSASDVTEPKPRPRPRQRELQSQRQRKLQQERQSQGQSQRQNQRRRSQRKTRLLKQLQLLCEQGLSACGPTRDPLDE